MCGIAGYMLATGAAEAEAPGAVQRMTDRIRCNAFDWSRQHPMDETLW